MITSAATVSTLPPRSVRAVVRPGARWASSRQHRRARRKTEAIITTMAPETAAHRGRAQARPRSGRRAGRAWLTVLAAAVATTAVVLALVAAGRLDAGTQPPAWRENVSLAIMVVGMVGVVAGMVWLVATGTFTSGDLARVRPFTSEQRRQAARTIRHGQPAADGAQEVTAVTTRITARQRASSPTMLGIVLICLGILLQTSSPSGLLLVATGGILAGVALQLPNIRTAHRAQHWLDTTYP